MKIKCHYCGYHTNRSGFCADCACYNYIMIDKIYKTVMFVIIKSTQFKITSLFTEGVTYISAHNNTILTLPNTKLTPQNVKQKLSLYLTFS